jgi:hypothetical protein
MKHFICFCIAVICACTLTAQRHPVEFGIKGGVNFASLRIQPDESTDSRTGFHLGMLTHIHLSRAFALQPELMYSSQGAGFGNDVKNKLNYVNIPLLVQIMFGEGFRLQTGPQIGFLASAKSKNNSTEVNIEDNLKKTDFSWSVGTGFISNSGLGIDVRYNIGINNISKADNDVQNRVWQVGLFYQFRR